nr:hypothetical protein F511_07660 [Ipomoea trifida]
MTRVAVHRNSRGKAANRRKEAALDTTPRDLPSQSGDYGHEIEEPAEPWSGPRSERTEWVLTQLRGLRQRYSLQNYFTKFVVLFFQVPWLPDEEAMAYLTNGLKEWARNEVWHANPETIDEALLFIQELARAEKLVKKIKKIKNRAHREKTEILSTSEESSSDWTSQSEEDYPTEEDARPESDVPSDTDPQSGTASPSEDESPLEEALAAMTSDENPKEKVSCDAPNTTLLDEVRTGLDHDPVARQIKQAAIEGKTKKFKVEDGLLFTTGRRVYVPKWNELRRKIMQECHDSRWAGHPGQKRTQALIERTYYWPQMRDVFESYVRTCLVCQQDKIEAKALAGLLEPLPIAEGPWDNITMDFINALPKADGCRSIFVVVDRFSKYGTFIPAPKDCSAAETARLFFKHVVKYWGLPRHIISDRDPRFTGKMWKELFQLMGSDLHFSTSFHPQSDGQTERVNALLECYLRHFVSANQRDLVKMMDAAQFSYNLQKSEATGHTPFELATGRQPLTPASLATSYKGCNPGAYVLAKTWEEQADLARANLAKAAKKMKKWADKGRRPKEYGIGDMVMVKLQPRQFKALWSLHPGLLRKYVGPYPVLEKVGKVSYRVELPPNLKIHPIFHASVLKPHHKDLDDPGRNESTRAPPLITKAFDKELKEILDRRRVSRRGPKIYEYLVSWKGSPDDEATWETEDNLCWYQSKDRSEREASRRLANSKENDDTRSVLRMTRVAVHRNSRGKAANRRKEAALDTTPRDLPS